MLASSTFILHDTLSFSVINKTKEIGWVQTENEEANLSFLVVDLFKHLKISTREFLGMINTFSEVERYKAVQNPIIFLSSSNKFFEEEIKIKNTHSSLNNV